MLVTEADEFVQKAVADPRWLAECLQRIGRFGGQHPVSNVLVHSLEVSHFAKYLGPRAELWALYHDAHEVLFGDLTRTARTSSPALCELYSAICDELDVQLQTALKLSGLLNSEVSAVSQCDKDSGDIERGGWHDVSYCCDGHNAVDYFETRALALMAVVNVTTDPVLEVA